MKGESARKVQWTLFANCQMMRLWFDFLKQTKKPFSNEKGFEVRMKGVEPPRLAALDPKSSMSTNSITSAYVTITTAYFYNGVQI